ncbi:MAG TPA: hypothetical protein VEH31_19220 [Streptosporangiaceae bacterium]|nr:hypothetical protein [Streptosporangiaceae bacterium]
MSPQRDDNETTTHRTIDCPICARPFTPVRRQAYCTPACKQVAWRRRIAPGTPAAIPPRRDRSNVVYQCGECDTRYLAQQWCHDCARPCRRLGPGGECGHCGELLTAEELLDNTLRT